MSTVGGLGSNQYIPSFVGAPQAGPAGQTGRGPNEVGGSGFGVDGYAQDPRMQGMNGGGPQGAGPMGRAGGFMNGMMQMFTSMPPSLICAFMGPGAAAAACSMQCNMAMMSPWMNNPMGMGGMGGPNGMIPPMPDPYQLMASYTGQNANGMNSPYGFNYNPMGQGVPGMPNMPGMPPNMPGMPPNMPGMPPNVPGMQPNMGQAGQPQQVPDPFSDGQRFQDPRMGPVIPSYQRASAENRLQSDPSTRGPALDRALKEYTPQDLANFHAVRNLLESEDDKADLDDLAVAGKLQDRDIQGHSLVSNLARLGTQPLARGLDNQSLLSQTVRTLTNPDSIKQGKAGTATAANVQYMMARRTPSEMVRHLLGLSTPNLQAQIDPQKSTPQNPVFNWKAVDQLDPQAQTPQQPGGWVRTQTGATLHRVDNSLTDDGTGRSDVDRILQASLTQQARVGFGQDLAQATQQDQQRFADTLNHTDPTRQLYDSQNDRFLGADQNNRVAEAGSGLTAAEMNHLLSNTLGQQVHFMPAGQDPAAVVSSIRTALARPMPDHGEVPPVLTNLKGANGPLQVQVYGVHPQSGDVRVRMAGGGDTLDLGNGVTIQKDPNGRFTIPGDQFKNSLEGAFIPAFPQAQR